MSVRLCRGPGAADVARSVDERRHVLPVAAAHGHRHGRRPRALGVLPRAPRAPLPLWCV